MFWRWGAAAEVQPPLEHIAAQEDGFAQAGPNAVAGETIEPGL
jgi:hypothetical protein